jgi:hypothetical protein
VVGEPEAALVTMRTVRLVLAALAAGDLAFAILLARRHRLADWAFGSSEGIWRTWAVGDLVAYAAVQGVVAARPPPAGRRAVAFLRAQLVPAHAGRALLNPARTAQSAAIGTMNATVAINAWQAAEQHEGRERVAPGAAGGAGGRGSAGAPRQVAIRLRRSPPRR